MIRLSDPPEDIKRLIELIESGVEIRRGNRPIEGWPHREAVFFVEGVRYPTMSEMDTDDYSDEQKAFVKMLLGSAHDFIVWESMRNHDGDLILPKIQIPRVMTAEERVRWSATVISELDRYIEGVAFECPNLSQLIDRVGLHLELMGRPDLRDGLAEAANIFSQQCAVILHFIQTETED